jgi:hypothetical protein
MAPRTWMTPEQAEFAVEEDSKWELVKASGNTLRSFYIQTTTTFLEKWPIAPDQATLAAAGDDPKQAEKAHQLVFDKLYAVSLRNLSHFSTLSLH